MKPYSAITKRRLADGERAAALPEPTTRTEIEQQLEILYQGMAALQSLDDLGSEEANAKAWSDMEALQVRYVELQSKLKAMGK